jgi:chromosome segregation ATPase
MTLNAANATLQGQLTTLQGQLTAAQVETASLKSKADESARQQREQSSRVAELSRMGDLEGEKACRLQAKVDVLQAANEALEKQVAVMEGEKVEFVALVQQAEEGRKAVEEERAAMIQQGEDADAQNDEALKEVRRRLAESEAMSGFKEQELVRLRSELAAAIVQLNEVPIEVQVSESRTGWRLPFTPHHHSKPAFAADSRFRYHSRTRADASSKPNHGAKKTWPNNKMRRSVAKQ